MNPSEFERQVARIHELLERSHGDVTWNDHIPDPDNPKRLRQIDVAIYHDDKLTIIECRLSQSPQNVKWIEELMGRRQSVGAETVIAVASAGFTIGAQRKAARHGVILRDLCQLSEEEIASWCDQVTLTMYYYRYSNLQLDVGFALPSLSRIDPAVVAQEIRSHPVLQSVFNAAARKLDEAKLLANDDERKYDFGVCVSPEIVLLSCGEPVLELAFKGKARLVSQPITSPGAFRYANQRGTSIQREATVERCNLGETSVVHHENRIAINIDLSSVVLPPLSQIRYLRTAHHNELDYEIFAITNPWKLGVDGPISVGLYSL